MNSYSVSLSVFTKPWKNESIWELAKHVKNLQLDGVEFPLREGYQLEPEQAEKLPELVSQFADHGLQIFSLACDPNERIFAACAEANIPMIRVMAPIDQSQGYMRSEVKNREYLESLLPLSEKYNIKIGVQQHYGNHIVDSSGLLNLIDGLDERYIGAIWDSAHDALAGQQPEFGLDILWERLFMVNFKNAFYRLTSGPEAERAVWERYFTSGEHGLASWPRGIAYLKDRKFAGVICLTAEYTQEDDVNRLIRQDVQYIKSLIE